MEPPHAGSELVALDLEKVCEERGELIQACRDDRCRMNIWVQDNDTIAKAMRIIRS